MGYTKYVCPFGVLIVGKSDYKSESMQLAANYVANILDPKATGTVGKDDTIYHELREKVEQEKGLFLAGSTKETDAAACEAIESVSKFLRGKSSSSIPSTDLAAQLLKVGISSVIPGMGLFPLFGCVPLPTDEVLKRKNSE